MRCSSLQRLLLADLLAALKNYLLTYNIAKLLEAN